MKNKGNYNTIEKTNEVKKVRIVLSASKKVKEKVFEIAMGFFYQKKVYVLYEDYEPYVDELTGWDVIPLHGDIANITEKK